MMHPTYEEDFYGWAMASAQRLKQKKFDGFSEMDIEHLIEELEDIGQSQKDQLINRFVALLTHLLKWQFQATLRSHSWIYTLKEQRTRIQRLLKKNPSLKKDIRDCVKEAYEYARLAAARETGLKEEVFPSACPYTTEQCLDEAFYPE